MELQVQCSYFSCGACFSRNLLSPVGYDTLSQNNHKLLLAKEHPPPFPPARVWNSERQNRLLTIPEIWGTDFAAVASDVEQNLRLHIFYSQDPKKKSKKNKPLIFGALWVGFKELFCFCFKTFGKKTLDFEILFPYVPT